MHVEKTTLQAAKQLVGETAGVPRNRRGISLEARTACTRSTDTAQPSTSSNIPADEFFFFFNITTIHMLLSQRD